jgi:hypothetical protein
MSFPIVVICFLSALFISYKIGVITGYERSTLDIMNSSARALVAVTKIITDKGIKLGHMKRADGEVLWSNNEPILTAADVLNAEHEIGEHN